MFGDVRDGVAGLLGWGFFLAAGLDGEVGLAEGNYFFGRVRILDDQIAGIT